MILQFDRRSRAMVLDNIKSQTFRAKLPAGARVGAPITMMNGYKPGACFARSTIVAIDLVIVAEIDAADAVLDGFSCLAELLATIEAKYPGIDTVWRIRWTPPQSITKAKS